MIPISVRKLLDDQSTSAPDRLLNGPSMRWGIAGPGRIADNFVRALKTHTNQAVVAVGSRSLDRARTFAHTHEIPSAYGTYQALVESPNVDIVYVAVPNSAHLGIALLAVQAGKHVLVEKPLGIDAAEARLVQAAATSAGVFVMEGIWSRFLPQYRLVSTILRDGVLGEIKLVEADFSEKFTADEEPSVFNPQMAGGALRDLGVYPAWFAHYCLGAPVMISAHGSMTESGVDAQSVMTLGYANGAQAHLATSLFTTTPALASISGTEGTVLLRSPFLMPGGFTVTMGADQKSWTDTSGISGIDGLAWEATDVAQSIAGGHTESHLHTLDDTIAVSSVLDEARRQITRIDIPPRQLGWARARATPWR